MIGILIGLLILVVLAGVAGCASSPQIVYIGTEPTIYATDQAALIPTPPDPVWFPPMALPAPNPLWFGWQAPLNTAGLNFP